MCRVAQLRRLRHALLLLGALHTITHQAVVDSWVRIGPGRTAKGGQEAEPGRVEFTQLTHAGRQEAPSPQRNGSTVLSLCVCVGAVLRGGAKRRVLTGCHLADGGKGGGEGQPALPWALRTPTHLCSDGSSEIGDIDEAGRREHLNRLRNGGGHAHARRQHARCSGPWWHRSCTAR